MTLIHMSPIPSLSVSYRFVFNKDAYFSSNMDFTID